MIIIITSTFYETENRQLDLPNGPQNRSLRSIEIVLFFGFGLDGRAGDVVHINFASRLGANPKYYCCELMRELDGGASDVGRAPIW